MPHELRLSLQSGTPTYLYLTGPSATYCQVEVYAPQSPTLDERQSSSPYLSDGGEQVTSYKNVNESMGMLLKHSSTANLQQLIWDIENMLWRAAMRQRTGMGARVYVEFKPDGDTVWWRSEILGGRLVLDREDSMRGWASIQQEALLTLTRRYYWEGDEVALSMTSSVNGTPAESVTIYNNDNANTAQTCWVHFASTQVAGSIAAPPKLKVANAEAGTVSWVDWFISHNVINDPANYNPFLLGSASELGGATPTWTGAQAAWVEKFQWNLTTAQVQDCRGTFMRFLYAGSLGAVGQDTWVRAVVKAGVTTGGTALTRVWTGDAVPVISTDSRIWDLGSMPVPPGGYSTLYSAISVFLEIISTGTGSGNCDFLMLAPASTGFRRAHQHGYNIEQGDQFVDDPAEGRVYAYDAADDLEESIYTAMGNPVVLWPGVQQRLYFLVQHGTWSAGAGKTMTVSASIRPRKLSV
jgi:hypothetical protein